MSLSNQNAGADRKPCKWCQLWQAAYWASRLDPDQYNDPDDLNWSIWVANGVAWGDKMLPWLASLDPGECHGCQKARLIQLGTHQTPAETEWRAAQWRDNPTVRWMMRAGEHDTFTEAGDET